MAESKDVKEVDNAALMELYARFMRFREFPQLIQVTQPTDNHREGDSCCVIGCHEEQNGDETGCPCYKHQCHNAERGCEGTNCCFSCAFLVSQIVADAEYE